MGRGEALWLGSVLLIIPFSAAAIAVLVRKMLNSGHLVAALIVAYLMAIATSVGLVYLGIWMRWLS